MIIFKKYYILEQSKELENALTNVLSRLEANEFLVKIKGRRVFAYTKDNRRLAMDRIIKLFSDRQPTLIKPVTRSIRNISTIGYISLNNGIDVVVKPIGGGRKDAEIKASNDLNDLIQRANEKEEGPIKIKIGDEVIEGIVSANSERITGDPKADIVLINADNKEVGFISHKKEGGPAAFQQYGGISKEAGLEIYNNPIVEDFLKTIKDYMQEKFNTNVAENGMSFKREIPDSIEGKNLLGKSVYGPDWSLNSKNYGREFVNCIGQGNPKLKRKDEYYVLDFSDTMHTSDEIDWVFKGGYKAYLAATFRTDRRIEGEDFVLENLRGGIYPKEFISHRKAILI